MEFDPSGFDPNDGEIRKMMDDLEKETAASRRLWPDTIEEEERRFQLLNNDSVYQNLDKRCNAEGLSRADKQEAFDQSLDRMKEIMTAPNPEDLIVV